MVPDQQLRIGVMPTQLRPLTGPWLASALQLIQQAYDRQPKLSITTLEQPDPHQSYMEYGM